MQTDRWQDQETKPFDAHPGNTCKYDAPRSNSSNSLQSSAVLFSHDRTGSAQQESQ